MGNRAIYIRKEQGEIHFFQSHWGANALSPLLRFLQAKEWQARLPEQMSVTRIWNGLDCDGKYHNEPSEDTELFCELISADYIPVCQQDYAKRGYYEMRITLDLDENSCQLEYNPNCACYRTMGTYAIDLDTGLENVQKLLAYAEQQGIDDFGRLPAIYHNSTGLAEKLEDSRGSMRIEEYLNSLQAQEDRERYLRLFGHQEELDAGEDEEEMEER